MYIYIIHVCSHPLQAHSASIFCQTLQWSMFNMQTIEDEGNDFDIYIHSYTK